MGFEFGDAGGRAVTTVQSCVARLVARGNHFAKLGGGGLGRVPMPRRVCARSIVYGIFYSSLGPRFCSKLASIGGVPAFMNMS